jgi:hypothetical protein
VLPDAASGRKVVPVGHQAVTVRGGYGVVFAVMAQVLLHAGAIAVQVISEQEIYHRLQSWLRALAQLSRYKL